MIVPWSEVPQDTLLNLVEEFVTRDGTDYGEREVGLENRVAQVLSGLRRGEIVLFFDEITETVSVLDRERAQVLLECRDATPD